MGDANYLTLLTAKIDLICNKLEELKDFSEMVERFLSETKLSTSERIFVLQCLSNVYELRIDFLTKVQKLNNTRNDFLLSRF